MKRLAYGATIGFIGVLAIMAVNLQLTQEVSVDGNTYALHGSQCLVDFQDQFEPLRPLIIDRGAPALPPPVSEDFMRDGSATLSLSCESAFSPQDLTGEKGSNGDSFVETGLPVIESSDFGRVDLGIGDDLTIPEHEYQAPVDDMTDGRRTGFIMLDEAMMKHPLWMEVVRIGREIETSKSRWRSYVDASGLTEEDVLRCLDVAEQCIDEQVSSGSGSGEGFKMPEYAGVLESGLALVETSLRQEVDARIEAKATELKAELEDRLYAERARLNNEFDEFKDRVVKESYLIIVNTQMKLRLLKLSDAEREALEDELRRVNDDIEEKLTTKRKALDEIYALYEAQETAEAEGKLMRYREEQTCWLSSKLQEERDRLAKEVEGLFSDASHTGSDNFKMWQENASRRGRIELSNRYEEISKEFREREAQFTEELGMLTANQQQMQDRIKEDIYHVVSDLKNDMGILIEVIEAVEEDSRYRETELGDIDVTPDVIRIIRNRE